MCRYLVIQFFAGGVETGAVGHEDIKYAIVQNLLRFLVFRRAQ